MSAVARLAGWLANASAITAGAIMLLMMLQIAFDVILKHLANAPIPATLETVSSYYMVALVYLPLGLVTKRRGHIVVELFTQDLAPRRLAAVEAFGGVVGMLYVGALVWRGSAEAQHMTAVGEVWETATWNMQVWPARWFFPVGCALMLAFLVLHTIDSVARAVTGRGPLLDAAPG
ncbi:TRAP transporter small permease subunit [Acuticoccus sp.]|uniref:TRAP transporter small permease subunit n=1 Tax=Acuticoccus sp. TaxID=1904378 RepID=UPI003B51F35A